MQASERHKELAWSLVLGVWTRRYERNESWRALRRTECRCGGCREGRMPKQGRGSAESYLQPDVPRCTNKTQEPQTCDCHNPIKLFDETGSASSSEYS